MSTENTTGVQQESAYSVVREYLVDSLMADGSQGQDSATLYAESLLGRLEAEAVRTAREAARQELESRFDPEARKLDRFVAGWLSAAEHLTADPLTGESRS